MTSQIPHDAATEAYVLGALMNHGELLGETPELTDEYFWRPDHRMVFAAISEIVCDGGTPDLIQVTRLLEARKELVKAGGPGAVTEMVGAALTRNIDYQLSILRDYAARRKTGAIAAPFVRLVMPGVFEHWQRFHRRWGDQAKIPRCRSDRLLADDLAVMTNFARD